MKEFIRECLPPGEWKKNVPWEEVEELRLRSGRPVEAVCFDRVSELACRPDAEAIRRMVAAMAEHSLHAYAEQMRQGFLTLPGGVRIGLAGRAVMEAGRIVRMEDLTSVNIRFPREVRGAAQSVLPYLLDRGSLRNTLIVSPPQQGKTTLLRDLIRCAADGAGCLAQKCVVIDEREELWAEGFDLGRRTDVLRCAKRVGIPLAVRTLSPDCIATDELGDPVEFRALAQAVYCGVRILATAHGRDLADLRHKPFFRAAEGLLFDRFVLLSEEFGRGTVGQILDGEGRALLRRPLPGGRVSHAV